MFNSNFKFNGTSRLKDLFENLGISAFQAVRTDAKGNIVFNVAGFKKDEISIHYKDETIEITCNGNSPYFGTSYSISADIPGNAKPSVKYSNGCVIVTPQIKSLDTELKFDEETLLD